MLNSSERNRDALEEDQKPSKHNQNDELVVDSIEIDDSNLSTLEVEDIDSSSVELDHIELSDVKSNNVELNDVKSDDVTLNSVELDEVESIDVELVDVKLNDFESVDAELNGVESNDIASDNVELNDVEQNNAKVDNVESLETALDNVESSTVELSDIESKTVESDDIKLNDRKSNDADLDNVESKSIKLDSTKLESVEIVADDEAPIAVSSTDHLTDTKAMDRMPAHVTTGSSLTPRSRLAKTPKITANGSRAFIWYALALVVLIIDQWTKWLAETNLVFNEPIPVIEPFLNWTLAYNYGAAFSFLANAGGWQKWFFSGLALVMSIFLTVYLTKAPRQAKLLSVGLALVLGGAIGNLIDRLRLGKVVRLYPRPLCRRLALPYL